MHVCPIIFLTTKKLYIIYIFFHTEIFCQHQIYKSKQIQYRSTIFLSKQTLLLAISITVFLNKLFGPQNQRYCCDRNALRVEGSSLFTYSNHKLSFYIRVWVKTIKYVTPYIPQDFLHKEVSSLVGQLEWRDPCLLQWFCHPNLQPLSLLPLSIFHHFLNKFTYLITYSNFTAKYRFL